MREGQRKFVEEIQFWNTSRLLVWFLNLSSTTVNASLSSNQREMLAAVKSEIDRRIPPSFGRPLGELVDMAPVPTVPREAVKPPREAAKKRMPKKRTPRKRPRGRG